MNILQPPAEITALVNASRGDMAATMDRASAPDARMLAVAGVCGVDALRLAGSDQLAAVDHAVAMNGYAHRLPDLHYVTRLNGGKPRTKLGFTGLIHQPGGAKQYVQGATHLVHQGVPVAAEVMSDIDYAVAAPYLTMGWVGARDIGSTAARYVGRPTDEDLENGIHPLPMWVKHDQSGDLDNAVNALHTLRSDTPEPRLRLTASGQLRTMDTHANPHTGLILRGSDIRPHGPLDEIMATSIISARQRLDAEFGPGVPIIVDASHAHANKWAEGGEAGQLTILHTLGELILRGIPIDGIMAETYIHGGKQPAPGRTPGVSITDACISQPNAQRALTETHDDWVLRPALQSATIPV